MTAAERHLDGEVVEMAEARPVGFIQKDSLGGAGVKEVDRREGKDWAEDEGPCIQLGYIWQRGRKPK